MNTSLSGLTWLTQSYSEGFSVAFCSDESPSGFIERLGADPAQALPMTREEAEAVDLYRNSHNEDYLDVVDLDPNSLQEAGWDLREGASVIRFGAIAGWAYAIQPYGSYLGQEEVITPASIGARIIAVTQTVNASTGVAYAVDGRLVASFDPSHPANYAGSDFTFPDRKEGEDYAVRFLKQLGDEFSLAIPPSSDDDKLLTACIVGNQ